MDRAEKLPDDGTLVPKHVTVGTCYDLCFVIYCHLISAFCWFLKIRNSSRSLSYGRRWEDNIKMDLQEVGGGRGDWMELA